MVRAEFVVPDTDPIGPPDHPVWRRALSDIQRFGARARRLTPQFHSPRKPEPAFIKALVTDAGLSAGIDPALLLSRRRKYQLVRIRTALWSQLRDYGYGVCAIGTAFNRDHSTVSVLVRKYREEWAAQCQ